METESHACIACGHTSERVPLLQMEYRGQTFWVCPQHLPILIHKPEQLAGKLPGAETFGAVSHDH